MEYREPKTGEEIRDMNPAELLDWIKRPCLPDRQRPEMNCEHGVSIHHDCEACTAEYHRKGQTWETKQIRRELAMVDARILDLMREREAERKLRRSYFDALDDIAEERIHGLTPAEYAYAIINPE